MEVSMNCEKETVRIIKKPAILRNKDVAAYYRYIFNECDTNRDGQITMSELKVFLVKNEGDIPDMVVRCLYNCFDKDNNQQLNFDEFLDMIIHPTVMQTFNRIGSRYLKLVAESSVRKKSLTLRRTITNTGLYEEEVTFNLCTISIIVITVFQIIIFYVDSNCKDTIKNYTIFHDSKKQQLWRYFTYVLNHNSSGHLYGNLVIQLALGIPLEMVHSWRVPLIYIAGAAGGSLMSAACHDTDFLEGASGSIYSLYTAHLATIIMNWREISHPCVSFLIFAIIIVFDLIREVVFMPSEDVSYYSHLGGAVIGLPMGVLILRNLKRTNLENIIWNISLVILSLVVFGLVLQNVLIDMEKNLL